MREKALSLKPLPTLHYSRNWLLHYNRATLVGMEVVMIAKGALLLKSKRIGLTLSKGLSAVEAGVIGVHWVGIGGDPYWLGAIVPEEDGIPGLDPDLSRDEARAIIDHDVLSN